MSILNRLRLSLLISLAVTLLTACLGGEDGGNNTGSPPAVTLQSITATATNAALTVGSNEQLTATANYSDASTKDITATATWSSNATAVATVSNSGQVTALASGTAVITATVGPVSGQVTLNVTAPPVQAIVNLPPVSVLPLLPPLEFVFPAPQAQTITLRPVADNKIQLSDLSGQDDAHVNYADYADRAYPTGELVVGCAWSSFPIVDQNFFTYYDVRKNCAGSLVKFDLSALAGKTILSAQLRLNVSGVGIGINPQPWTVAAFGASWSSGSVTWKSADWNAEAQGHLSYEYERLWYLAPAYGGATDLAVDRSKVVQAWVDGALPNHGFYLGLADYKTIYTMIPSNDAFAFFGNEDPQGRGPRLIVTYQ